VFENPAPIKLKTYLCMNPQTVFSIPKQCSQSADKWFVPASCSSGQVRVRVSAVVARGGAWEGEVRGRVGFKDCSKRGSAAANTAHPPQSSPSIVYEIWLAD